MNVRSSSIPAAAVVGAAVLLFAAGIGTAVWVNRKGAPPVGEIPAGGAEFELEVSSSRVSAGQPQAYLLEIAGDRLQLVPNPVSVGAGASETAIVERALKEVLAAANDPNSLSMIPAGTRLLDVKVAADGIHVNVSQEFRSGGGSASMIARVAQIIYTATSVDPKASVFLSIEGRPIDRNLPLGGEGLILRQPTTRAEFREDFSLS